MREWLQRTLEFRLPMSRYGALFNAAIARTFAHGLVVEPFQIGPVKSAVTEVHGINLLNRLSTELGSEHGLSADKIAFRCGQISRAMKTHVAAVTSHPTTLTIGTVTRNGRALWGVERTPLSRMKAKGQYHVWLTLPWLDIMDFTLNVCVFR